MVPNQYSKARECQILGKSIVNAAIIGVCKVQDVRWFRTLHTHMSKLILDNVHVRNSHIGQIRIYIWCLHRGFRLVVTADLIIAYEPVPLVEMEGNGKRLMRRMLSISDVETWYSYHIIIL